MLANPGALEQSTATVILQGLTGIRWPVNVQPEEVDCLLLRHQFRSWFAIRHKNWPHRKCLIFLTQLQSHLKFISPKKNGLGTQLQRENYVSSPISQWPGHQSPDCCQCLLHQFITFNSSAIRNGLLNTNISSLYS